MASELRTNSAGVEKTRVQRTKVPWVTACYDDEAVLIAVRSSHPVAKWKEIQQIFNSQVPERRWRTLEAIYSKAKLICCAYNPPEERLMASNAVEPALLPSNRVCGNVYVMPLTPLIYGNLLLRQSSFRQRPQQRTWKYCHHVERILSMLMA